MSRFALDDIPLMRALALGLLLVLSAFAQAQKGEYSVKGAVQNAVTGEPVRNALVRVMKVPSDAFGAGAVEPQEKAMLSGPGGEFRFEGLTEGLYAYVAHKPGFAQDGNLMNLKTFVVPRPSVDAAVQIQLSALGALEGKVVNQYDEPLEKPPVSYALTYFPGGNDPRAATP